MGNSGSNNDDIVGFSCVGSNLDHDFALIPRRKQCVRAACPTCLPVGECENSRQKPEAQAKDNRVCLEFEVVVT